MNRRFRAYQLTSGWGVYDKTRDQFVGIGNKDIAVWVRRTQAQAEADRLNLVSKKIPRLSGRG